MEAFEKISFDEVVKNVPPKPAKDVLELLSCLSAERLAEFEQTKTLLRVYLDNGIVISWWHKYRAYRDIENHCRKLADKFGCKVKKIDYWLYGLPLNPNR